MGRAGRTCYRRGTLGRPSTSAELRAALAAGDHAAVIASATDLDLAEARCRASIDTLLDDLGFVLRGAPTPLPAEARLDHISGARLDRVALAILETVIDASRELLARDPSRLLPILHDELYWYDAPARAAHGDAAMPAGERRLWRWMEHHAAIEVRAGARWLRSLRPPQASHAALPRWRMPGKVRAVSPDGASALVERDALCLLDLGTGAVRMTFAGAAQGRFTPDGAGFVVCDGRSAAFWATATLAPGIVLGPHTSNVQDAVFSRDGQVVFVEASDEVRAYRVVDGARLATRPLARRGLLPCGDGALLYDEKCWQQWDPVHDRLSGGAITAAYADWTAASPAGDRVVVHESGTVAGFALPEAEPLFQATGWAYSVAFHPGGRAFATSEGRLRDATTGAQTAALPVRDAQALAFDPTGRCLLASYWNRVEIVELAAAAVVARVDAARPDVLVSGDGRVVVVNDRHSALIADLTALGSVVHWRDDRRRIRTEWTTRFSPSGATLVVDHEGGIGFWDTARGVIGRFVEAGYLRAFSATGHRVFAGQGDQLIALWTEDGAEIWRATLTGAPDGRLDADVYPADAQGVVLHGHTRAELVIALGMDDGRERYRLAGTLALHDRDVFLIRDANGVHLRAIETGARIATLPGLRGGRFALSPDRRWLAVHDHAVTLWDLTTGSLRHTRSPAHTFSGFAFRADSAALVITSYQTQQSGNQDWNAEESIDVSTGARLDEKGWWDHDAEPAAPREIAPGVLREGNRLRVDGTLIPLPDEAVVCPAASGDLFVASTAKGRVELFVLTPAPR